MDGKVKASASIKKPHSAFGSIAVSKANFLNLWVERNSASTNILSVFFGVSLTVKLLLYI